MMENRCKNLLDAVNDLIGKEDGPPIDLMRNAPSAYMPYYSSYVAELRLAKIIADAWMERIINTEAERIGDRIEAKKNIAIRRPLGAVVHPMVIHCIRKAWLTCQGLNDGIPKELRVAPQAFVLAWLDQMAEQELCNFVATLPFWPMGQNETGRWI
jgi:hypothetical protein